MGKAIGGSLPLAVGIALSPIPIIAVVLMLTSHKAKVNGQAHRPSDQLPGRLGVGGVTVPASVLAQAIRRPDRQVRLARLIRQPTTDVIDLGRVDATNVGRLLAASGTSDIADAHMVICARRADQPVVTSDPGDLCQLDPALRLIAL